jgi:hypothetical protein
VKELQVVTGYAHPGYADSLSEFGSPRFLAATGAWVLERQIENSAYLDAMGCYPIFSCRNWAQLDADLESLGNDLVCLSLVTDPFGEYDSGYLRQCFRDVVKPFKEHFVVDLHQAPETFVHPHHQRNARRALRDLRIERCATPVDFLDDWTGLYGTLIRRHNIKGIAAFSNESFARQMNVPGIVSFRAMHNEATVGMVLWYAQENRAYYHLGAYSARGYELRASFALFSCSIQYFAEQGLDWLDLGAGAGTGAGESGLSRFKQGWSTGCRTAYFCGRIFDEAKYDELVRGRKLPSTDYFPAYRAGEFG